MNAFGGLTGRVGSGRVWPNSRVSGRATLLRDPTRPGPTRPDPQEFDPLEFDPIRERPFGKNRTQKKQAKCFFGDFRSIEGVKLSRSCCRSCVVVRGRELAAIAVFFFFTVLMVRTRGLVVVEVAVAGGGGVRISTRDHYLRKGES